MRKNVYMWLGCICMMNSSSLKSLDPVGMTALGAGLVLCTVDGVQSYREYVEGRDVNEYSSENQVEETMISENSDCHSVSQPLINMFNFFSFYKNRLLKKEYRLFSAGLTLIACGLVRMGYVASRSNGEDSSFKNVPKVPPLPTVTEPKTLPKKQSSESVPVKNEKKESIGVKVEKRTSGYVNELEDKLATRKSKEDLAPKESVLLELESSVVATNESFEEINSDINLLLNESAVILSAVSIANEEVSLQESVTIPTAPPFPEKLNEGSKKGVASLLNTTMHRDRPSSALLRTHPVESARKTAGGLGSDLQLHVVAAKDQLKKVVTEEVYRGDNDSGGAKEVIESAFNSVVAARVQSVEVVATTQSMIDSLPDWEEDEKEKEQEIERKLAFERSEREKKKQKEVEEAALKRQQEEAREKRKKELEEEKNTAIENFISEFPLLDEGGQERKITAEYVANIPENLKESIRAKMSAGQLEAYNLVLEQKRKEETEDFKQQIGNIGNVNSSFMDQTFETGSTWLNLSDVLISLRERPSEGEIAQVYAYFPNFSDQTEIDKAFVLKFRGASDTVRKLMFSKFVSDEQRRLICAIENDLLESGKKAV